MTIILIGGQTNIKKVVIQEINTPKLEGGPTYSLTASAAKIPVYKNANIFAS